MTTEAYHAFRSQPPLSNTLPKTELWPYETLELANGLRVIIVSHHKLPYTSMRLKLDHAPPMMGDKVGCDAITAELLMRGTTTRSKAQLDAQVDYWGARLDANAEGLVGGVLSRYFEDFWQVFVDVLRAPAMDETELERIKVKRRSGLQAMLNDPSAIADNVYHRAVFGEQHPYGELITETSVDTIQLEDCKAHYDQYWQPRGNYLLVVGDITVDDVARIIVPSLSDWDPVALPPVAYDRPQKKARVTLHIHDRPTAVQTEVHVGYPLDLEPSAPGRTPARLMNHILGGGVFSGYLMQHLREDKGYTYGVRSAMHLDEHCSDFRISTSVGTDVTMPAIEAIFHEMNRLRNERVDAEHLTLAKNSMLGSALRSVERPMQLGERILYMERHGITKEHYERLAERLAGIDAAAVQRMAARYLTPDQADIILVGNIKGMRSALDAFVDQHKADVINYQPTGEVLKD